MKTERKFTKTSVDLDASKGGPGTLHGYIAKFDEVSGVIREPGVPPYVEVIKPGAFARTLSRDHNIKSLYNHNVNHPLGSTTAGTLILREDASGLYFENPLPDITVARDLTVSVGRKDIDGCSFRGTVVRSSIVKRPGKLPLRVIEEIDLFEVTPACVFPAYMGTSTAVRSGEAGPDWTVFGDASDDPGRNFAAERDHNSNRLGMIV